MISVSDIMEREYTKNEIMSVKRPLLFIKSSYPIIQISDNIKLEREREIGRREYYQDLRSG